MCVLLKQGTGNFVSGLIILQNKSPIDAFILGIFLYGVFDMTNFAMFTKYSWKTALSDTLWGGTLFAFTTWVTYKLVAML